jgi:thiamine-phosphate pyrophosphorylase
MAELYLISPPQIDLEKFANELEAALSTGLVSVFQLRLKDVNDAAIIAAIQKLQPIARKYDAAFLLNDRPDLAAHFDCDGVHIGQKDMPYEAARRILGPDKMIGVTCHDSKDLAYDAAEAGADYVAFGAFYSTTTKDSRFRPAPELLRDWRTGALSVWKPACRFLTAARIRGF